MKYMNSVSGRSEYSLAAAGLGATAGLIGVGAYNLNKMRQQPEDPAFTRSGQRFNKAFENREQYPGQYQRAADDFLARNDKRMKDAGVINAGYGVAGGAAVGLLASLALRRGA